MQEHHSGTQEQLTELVERVLRRHAPTLSLPPDLRWLEDGTCSVEVRLFCMELFAA
jgi:hypothetical protein